MLQNFDGTEALTYQHEDHCVPVRPGFEAPQCFIAKPDVMGGVPMIRFTGHPPWEVIDCVAEVRNMYEMGLRGFLSEDAMIQKVPTPLNPDGKAHREWTPAEAGSLDEFPTDDHLVDTQLGCASEIAEALQ